MITVKKEEYNSLVASSENILVSKCKLALDKLKKGEDIDNVSLSVSYCNLITLRGYKTSEFNPEEYFNVLDPVHVVKSYSNINSIDNG